MKPITLIKLIHTIIWLFFNVVIFYVLYAAITGKIDKWVWICIGLVLLEGLVLLVFKNLCPVTVIAKNTVNPPNIILIFFYRNGWQKIIRRFIPAFSS
jgi:hypothetical protein